MRHNYLVLLALCVHLAGCGGADATGALKNDQRKLEFEHESCAIESAVKVDVNGDGAPDLWQVMSGGREVCRAFDGNFDGVKDSFVYYDEQGRERRRESDFDRDGIPDEVTISEGGVVVRKERETNYDSKIDTWEYYEGGRLAKTERDSDADGIIDEWWDFNQPDKPQCAVIVTDRNSDGKPDPDSAVDLCGESYKAPPPPTLQAATETTSTATAPAPPK